MKLYRWDELKKEEMNPLLARRYIAGDQIMLAMIYLKKGCVVPMHSHENEQMTTVISGSMKFDIGGREIVVKTGETLHIPSQVPHSAEALEDTEEMDVFTPIRQDWIDGRDDYLRR
jgi:quercetin dioxygenase-like cupin family protein